MKEPTLLKELLGTVLNGLGIANPTDAVALMEQWATLAPTPWAERSAPTSLRRGVLEVDVADGATASLLKYQERQLIDHLASAVGAGLVTAVRFRVIRH